jgi:hypothetical protein
MKYRITGIMMIVVPIAFNIVFFALSSSFEYPDILREPTDTILTKFQDGGDELVALWYSFAMVTLLAIPLTLLLHSLFVDQFPKLAQAAAYFGVLSGMVQVLGLLRWAFLVPILADRYTHATDAATRESAVMVFEAAHRYLGMAVGEHLGYLFTGIWTILLCAMMFRSVLFSRWLAVLGIVSAVGIITGMLEPAGWEAAGVINALSYVLWSIWMLMAGIMLLVKAPAPEAQPRQKSSFAANPS